jgi:hypothetical protein
MSEEAYYPSEQARDHWVEFLLRLTEGNATDTQLEKTLEEMRVAIYPHLDIDEALELLCEHQTEWQDYFHAKKVLRQQLLKIFRILPLN